MEISGLRLGSYYFRVICGESHVYPQRASDMLSRQEIAWKYCRSSSLHGESEEQIFFVCVNNKVLIIYLKIKDYGTIILG